MAARVYDTGRRVRWHAGLDETDETSSASMTSCTWARSGTSPAAARARPISSSAPTALLAPPLRSVRTTPAPDVRIMRRPRRLSARKSAPGGVEYLPFALASPGAGCRGRSGGRSWGRVELRAPNRTPLAVVGCQALPASSRGTRRCRRGRRRRRMRTIVPSAERRCLPGRRADRRNGTRA
jgi:hypothetical protein